MVTFSRCLSWLQTPSTPPRNLTHPWIFVNWMASKEGLEIYARAHEVATTRTDIDEKSYLLPEKIPQPGVKYFDNSNFEFVTTNREMMRRYVKKLLQR